MDKQLLATILSIVAFFLFLIERTIAGNFAVAILTLLLVAMITGGFRTLARDFRVPETRPWWKILVFFGIFLVFLIEFHLKGIR